MSTLTLPGLVALLRELPLLEATASQELSGLADRCGDASGLIRELQRRGWLTVYQVKVLLAGQGTGLVLGAYLLLDFLGQGTMGRVYQARHLPSHRLAALKVIPPETLHCQRLVKRFQREVFAASQLVHPHIVRSREAGQIGQTCFLAMEYIDGIDLSHLVKQNGPLPVPLGCHLIRQAALALQYAHDKDMIHRDIKPANLMVVRSAEHPPLVKVLDFGLARFLIESDGEGRLTQVGGVVGTVDYISPEQAANARQADARSDIFSLGATLFYLLTGLPPYAGKDVVEKISSRTLGNARRLSAYRGNLPAGLADVVAKMMARDPAFRYSTAQDVARALEPFCQAAPVALLVPPAAVRSPQAAPMASLEPAASPAPAPLVVKPPRAQPSVLPVRLLFAVLTAIALVVGCGSVIVFHLLPKPPKKETPNRGKILPVRDKTKSQLDAPGRDVSSFLNRPFADPSFTLGRNAQ